MKSSLLNIAAATMDLLDPGELLEETWFFGNSLHGKSRMFTRRHSDPPCPTSNSIQGMNLVAEKSMEETYSSIKKIPEGTLTRAGPGLMKTTSMPPNVKNSKESSTRIYSTMKQLQMQCGHLSRAPSLPTFAEKEELFQDDDEESEFSMGKLIRQASLNHARVQPPLPSVKGRLTRSCSISTVPKQRISKITGGDYEEIKQGKLTHQSLARKSVYDNRTEGLNKSLMSLKLQERERDEENVLRRRNCSEVAWVAKSCGTPPTPFQKSSGEDMKAQIKFWARAVARHQTCAGQEC